MLKVSRLVIGVNLNLWIWAMLALNIFVLVCIKKGASNGFYLLATFNMLCDLAQLILHALYIGPSILAGDWFFDGQTSLGVTIVGTLFVGFWVLASFMQVLFATNRLVVICFPKWYLFSSKKKTFLYIVIVFILSVPTTLYPQLISPCCRTTPDQRWFGYSILRVENIRNDSFIFGLFFDTTVTIYCSISYIALMIYIKKLSSFTSTALKREIRCLFQFLLTFVTYAITWITFYGFPITKIQIPEAYVVTPAVLVFNSGANSIIFLVLNKDVKVAARKLCK